MPAPFVLFGPGHLVALVATAAVSWLLTRLVRADPAGHRGRAVRRGLAALLLLATTTYLAYLATLRPLEVWDFVPLHLCDFLILLASFALVTCHQPSCELLYYWATGAVLAMTTPDLAFGFPHPEFLAFFTLHGGVVAAASVMTFGAGMRPRAGGPGRAFAVTLGYAAVVATVNVLFGTNFLYLQAKPAQPTLLDRLGPWPAYLVAAALLALGLFWLADLPFRQGRATTPRPP
jgi:hypothetical integral membrane protein (TIGR02206 family)